MIRLLALIAALLLYGGAADAQRFPPLSGLVVDAANVLPPATRADLAAKLSALQHDTHRQLVVATIPDLQGYPLEDYGYRLGRAWGVGLKGSDNGAILFIAPNEPHGHRGPRIEVGYGLEPILTDALTRQIIFDQMIPKLRGQDVPGAMTAGTDAIIAHLRASPDDAKARTDAAVTAFDKAHRGRGRSGMINTGAPIGLIFLMVVVFVVLGTRRRSFGQRYHSGTDWGTIALWAASEALRNSGGRSGFGGSDFGGGGSTDSGSSGGWGDSDFSGGGGGSFGGGGASGDW